MLCVFYVGWPSEHSHTAYIRITHTRYSVHLHSTTPTSQRRTMMRHIFVFVHIILHPRFCCARFQWSAPMRRRCRRCCCCSRKRISYSNLVLVEKETGSLTHLKPSNIAYRCANGWFASSAVRMSFVTRFCEDSVCWLGCQSVFVFGAPYRML